VRANRWQIPELWRRRRATGTTNLPQSIDCEAASADAIMNVDGTLPYSQPDTWSGPHA